MSDKNNAPAAPVYHRARFTFDKNVPIPPITHSFGHNGGGSKYPFKYMEVGESVLIPGPLDKTTVGRLVAAVSGARTAHKERRFIYRVLPEGFRVWRNMDVVPHKSPVK